MAKTFWLSHSFETSTVHDGVILLDKLTAEPIEFHEKKSQRMRPAIIWCWYLGVTSKYQHVEGNGCLQHKQWKGNLFKFAGRENKLLLAKNKYLFGVIVGRYIYLLADTIWHGAENQMNCIWKLMKGAQSLCFIEVRAMVMAVQQPSTGCTAIFTVCIV